MSRDAELEFPQPQVASNPNFTGFVDGDGQALEPREDSAGSIISSSRMDYFSLPRRPSPATDSDSGEPLPVPPRDGRGAYYKPDPAYIHDDRNGNSANEYFSTPPGTTPNNTSAARPFVNDPSASAAAVYGTSNTLGRPYKYHNEPTESSPTSSRTRSRRHKDRSSRTHDLIRLLLTQHAPPTESHSLVLLHQASERLEQEMARAAELERRLTEADTRWRAVNSARQTAQSDVNRLNEELRLYKVQLESAQARITQANENITDLEREKLQVEEEVAKAKAKLRRLETETAIKAARDEGIRRGREEGYNEGRKEGRREGRREAYRAAVERVRAQYDAYINGDVEGDGDDALETPFEDEDGPERRVDVDELDDVGEHMQMPIPESEQLPPSQPPQQMPPQQRAYREPPLQQQQQQQSRVLMPMPNTAPPRRARSGPANLIRRLTGRKARTAYDRNVEVNEDAPDVAAIQEDGPPRSMLTTPLPRQATNNVNYTRAPSPVGSVATHRSHRSRQSMRMPEPDYNPDVSNMRPITVHSMQRSPAHPPNEIPPEGYIPNSEADGSIALPPPHELSRMPPTPSQSPGPPLNMDGDGGGGGGAYAQEKEVIVRDYVQQDPYGNAQNAHASGMRPTHRRYGDRESVASVSTSNLSILSPNNFGGGGGGGMGYSGGLSAIPESSPGPRRMSSRHSLSSRMQPGDVGMGVDEDMYADAGGGSGMNPVPMPQGPLPIPSRPGSRASMRDGIGPGVGANGGMGMNDDALGMMNGVYPPSTPSTVPMPNLAGEGGMGMDAFSPRSGGMRGTPHSRAGSFGGPRRPAVLTTPAPLAPQDQGYSRPRINSGASDTGYTGFGSGPLGSGGDARSMRSGRTQVRMNAGARGPGGVGELPEINIEPPSRSESLQSRSGMPTPNDPHTPSYRNAPSPLSSSSLRRGARNGSNSNSDWPHPPGMSTGFNRPPSRQSFMGTAAPQSPALGVGRPASSLFSYSPGAVVLPILPDPGIPVPAPAAYSTPSAWQTSPVPRGFQTHSPAAAPAPSPMAGNGLSRGFVPAAPPPAMLPKGFVPASAGPSNDPLPSGFTPMAAAHHPLPAPEPPFIPPMPQPPASSARSYTGPEPPPGFVGSAVIPQADLPGEASPRLDTAGALPVMPRGRESWAGEHATSNSQAGAGGDPWAYENNENDNTGGWGAQTNSPMPMPLPPPRSDASSPGFVPPRPVSPRPPGVMPNGAGGGGIGPSLSRAGSRSTARSRATSGFGPGFGSDPTLIALPPTTAPSLAYRTNSSSSSGRDGGGRRGGSAYANTNANTYPYGNAPGSRSPSAKPVLGPQFGFGREPAPMPVAPPLARSNTFNSPRMDARTPGAVNRSMSVMDGGAGRSPRPVPMRMPGDPGMPPVGLQSPYSRRLQPQVDYANNAPAQSNYAAGATRFAMPPSTEGADSPRARVYPRTPAHRASDVVPDHDVYGGGGGGGGVGKREDIVIPGSPRPSALGMGFSMDRPMNAFTDRNPSLRRQASKSSIASGGSAYKRYNPDEYVDPAILASGESRLLPRKSKTGSDNGFPIYMPD